MGGKAVASKKKKTGSHDRMRYLKSPTSFPGLFSAEERKKREKSPGNEVVKSQQAQPARKTFLVFVKKNTRQLIMGVKPGNK